MTCLVRDRVTRVNERLRREWSIETGIIERIYTIDRSTTRLLIEQGIAALIPYGATNRPVGEVIQNKFRQWLDQAIALGLAQWERQL